MSLGRSENQDRLERLAELESELLGRIDAAVGELQRIECLDEEQRAEIHTILEAMKHDGLSHIATVQLITDSAGRERCHA